MARRVLSLLFLAACGGAAPTAQSSAPTTTTKANEAAADPDAPAPPVVALDCGDFTTCAIATDGVVRCWGSNKNGELGLPRGEKERTKRATVPGLLGKATSVAMASEMACVLLEDKKVMCWGSGRLANDGKEDVDAKPMPVEGVEGVEELGASGAMICARGSKGIQCWGADKKTLGTPPTGRFKQIAAGFTHGCALDEKGAVTCWGQGEWGGKGGFAKPAVTGALEVVTGDRHGCVIAKDKTVQCWGMNDAGQLGTKPDAEQHKKLVTVAGVKGATKLFVGEAANCALLEDGTTKCWGSNNEGELGLGSRSSDERPQVASDLASATSICFASTHACALTKDQKLVCWGANAYGQIGDGTKERRATPTAVSW